MPIESIQDGGQTSFGELQPCRLSRWLIASCKSEMMHHWFGQQWAQLVRGFVLRRDRLPLDFRIGKICMRCHLRDNNSERKFVFMPWRYDRVERAMMRSQLGQAGTLVDIGANVGIYTLDALCSLGPQGRVIAIEPHAPVLQRLEFNVRATLSELSDPPQIEIVPVGISDRAERISLWLDARNLGSSSIVSTTRRAQCVDIEVRPLLEVLRQCAVEQVDVLKIDIEGAEDRALMPFFAQAPAELLPKMILIENSEKHWLDDLPAAMRRCGYVCAARTRRNSVYTLPGSAPSSSR